jgi:ribose transport system substrate-binding protein
MRVGRQVTSVVATATMLTVGGAACGKPSEEASTTTEKPAVAFVVPNTSLNFAKEMATGFGSGVRQVGGVDYQIVGTVRNDNAGEAKLFKDVIDTGKADDGISLFMQASDVFAPLMAEAHRKNIPMIAVDNRPDPTSKIELFVGNDNYALGYRPLPRARSSSARRCPAYRCWTCGRRVSATA